MKTQLGTARLVNFDDENPIHGLYEKSHGTEPPSSVQRGSPVVEAMELRSIDPEPSDIMHLKKSNDDSEISESSFNLYRVLTKKLLVHIMMCVMVVP